MLFLQFDIEIDPREMKTDDCADHTSKYSAPGNVLTATGDYFDFIRYSGYNQK
jgi:hypothetical protein